MKRKSIKEEIREYFFTYPTAKLRVRQIEKKLGLPLPSVIRYCRELKDEKILSVVQMGNIVFYTADRASKEFILEKRLFNIKEVHESGLIDYLKKELSNPTVVLFGSYSKGEDTENSDIDVYIRTISKKNTDVRKFEKRLKKNIHLFRYRSINEVQNKNLANNIINGITLNGFIEVFS